MAGEAVGRIAAISYLPSYLTSLVYRQKCFVVGTDLLFFYPSWQQIYSALGKLHGKEEGGRKVFWAQFSSFPIGNQE